MNKRTAAAAAAVATALALGACESRGRVGNQGRGLQRAPVADVAPRLTGAVPVDRFECARDEDCVNVCSLGAVNRNWFAVNYPAGDRCEDGCDSREMGRPRCVDGQCAAFRSNGDPDRGCTHRMP